MNKEIEFIEKIRSDFFDGTDSINNIYQFYSNGKFIFYDYFISEETFNYFSQNGFLIQKKDNIHQGEKAKRFEFIDKIPSIKEILKLRNQKNNITPHIRFLVFKRDNYRCVFCGRSAKDNIELQVDHIIPKSKGGKNDISNYQTLCFECNIGKSNNLEHD